MMTGHIGEELISLGLPLLIAYVLARLVKRINLPAIPIYILVGMFFSINTQWFPLSLRSSDLELVAVLGLIMLLFSLGLEFDQSAFSGGNAKKIILSGLFFITINLAAGLAFGFAVGWGSREALLLGGIIATSSSAIITKLMISLRRLTAPEAPVILGVTVLEDIGIALYLVLVSILLGEGDSLLVIILKAVLGPVFLVFMFIFARRCRKFITRIIRVDDSELFTILFFGLAVVFAGIGERLGVTDAVGAFLIGMALGASRDNKEKLEDRTEPLRDVFAAFFFFSFGLSLNPNTFPEMLPLAVLAVVVTMSSSLVGSVLIVALSGLKMRSLLRVSFILHNRGEFALILAALAARAGLDPRVQSFSGLFVLIMAIVGPLMAANTDRITALVMRISRNGAKYAGMESTRQGRGPRPASPTGNIRVPSRRRPAAKSSEKRAAETTENPEHRA